MPSLSRKRRADVEESDISQDDEQEQNIGETAMNDMVKALVRLALAVEHQRRPLRRAEVGEKVLGTNGRQFKKVFTQAQHELRTIFGMELVELPSKDKITVAQKRAAQKEATKSVTSWILVSTLPSEYHDPAIIPTTDATYTAVYSTLVALISLNGAPLPEAKMERFLARLGMEDTTPTGDKPEKLLKRMEKDGYVFKLREPLGNGEEEITWVVGPRGKAEVGDAGVKGIVEAVYGNPDGEDGAMLAKRIDRSLGMVDKPAPVKKARQRRSTQHDDEDDD
ncbi:hypothetical protein AMS68_001586 [Peltaster fructicola]|uniref:MAGE domain-containing protein n=1 Tax=Peltaster fructicola TaxID=286661 RepID=A0A6H0XN68_9PEZI|nr:hypothetical protein AMS68_001586 [Peltaster fructicola]